MTLRPFVVSLLATLLLAACVVIPAPQREPFSEEVTGPLVSGRMARAEVLSRLGQPTAKNASGSLVVYREFQRQAVLIWGGGYSGGIEQLGTTHNLVIRYDNSGRVAQATITNDLTRICRTDGACLLTRFDLDIWRASEASTASVKARPATGRSCTVFVSDRSSAKWSSLDAIGPSRVVLLDGREQFRFLARYYWWTSYLGVSERVANTSWHFYRLELRPGRHVLDYNPHVSRDNGMTTEARPFEFTCRSGETLFLGPLGLKSESRSGAFHSRNTVYTFQRLDPGTAGTLLKSSRLLDFTG